MTISTVCVIKGDGVGPEVVDAALRILNASGVPVTYVYAEAGERAFASGVSSGVPEAAIDAVRNCDAVLKGPLGTPIGDGGKSANVTLRKMFETYANVRPSRTLPGVAQPGSNPIDLIVVRENVEDLYAGIEHTQAPGVYQALKVITDQGCDKIVRAAFDLANRQRRRRVTCVTKANPKPTGKAPSRLSAQEKVRVAINEWWSDDPSERYWLEPPIGKCYVAVRLTAQRPCAT